MEQTAFAILYKSLKGGDEFFLSSDANRVTSIAEAQLFSSLKQANNVAKRSAGAAKILKISVIEELDIEQD